MVTTQIRIYYAKTFVELSSDPLFSSILLVNAYCAYWDSKGNPSLGVDWIDRVWKKI